MLVSVSASASPWTRFSVSMSLWCNRRGSRLSCLVHGGHESVVCHRDECVRVRRRGPVCPNLQGPESTCSASAPSSPCATPQNCTGQRIGILCAQVLGARGLSHGRNAVPPRAIVRTHGKRCRSSGESGPTSGCAVKLASMLFQRGRAPVRTLRSGFGLDIGPRLEVAPAWASKSLRRKSLIALAVAASSLAACSAAWSAARRRAGVAPRSADGTLPRPQSQRLVPAGDFCI